jgi:hypothetical protein
MKGSGVLCLLEHARDNTNVRSVPSDDDIKE